MFRAPVVLAFPLALMLAYRERREWKDVLRFALLLAVGVMPAVLGQAFYNWARFGHPLEFGYRWMNSPGTLQARMRTWGQFSLHFLPENLYTLTVRLPQLSLAPLHIAPDPWGMGTVFTIPALLLVVASVRTAWRDLRQGALWLSIGLVALPSLLYFNTGSYQFGYRFALDWLPLAIVLLALSANRGTARWIRGLIIAGILMHLWGLLWMYPNFNGQPWRAQYLGWLR